MAKELQQATSSEVKRIQEISRGLHEPLRFRGGLDNPFGRMEFQWAKEPLNPSRLSLPLTQLGGRFTELLAREGQTVRPGDLLARSDNATLLSPVSGTITSVQPSKRRLMGSMDVSVDRTAAGTELVPPPLHSKTQVLREYAANMGIWSEIQAGMEMNPAAMDKDPRLVIVRCVFAEPHVQRGELILRKELDLFLRGLEILGRLAGGYSPIYLTINETDGALSAQIRQQLKGLAFAHLVKVPVRYPVENPLLLATLIGSPRDLPPSSIWFVDPQVVVALRHAFHDGRFWGKRSVSVAAPGLQEGRIVETPLGTPLGEIVSSQIPGLDLSQCCLLRGGIYSGERAEPTEGLAYRDRSLWVIQEKDTPEFLGWQMPGMDKHSWTKLFVAPFLGRKIYTAKTLIRGGKRPCIACGRCREVCPAGLYPHHLHRLVTHDCQEEAEAMGLLNCVECHSCSYGCVSKIELSREIIRSRRALLQEMNESQ